MAKPFCAAGKPREGEALLRGLVLRRGRHFAFHRQARQKCRDFRLAHLSRMPPVVKSDKAPDPLQVGILGAQSVVLHAHRLAHAVEQHFWLASGGRLRQRFHAKRPSAWQTRPAKATETGSQNAPLKAHFSGRLVVRRLRNSPMNEYLSLPHR